MVIVIVTYWFTNVTVESFCSATVTRVELDRYNHRQLPHLVKQTDEPRGVVA